ncbi:YybS family protein [Schinkia sp. CFF1]
MNLIRSITEGAVVIALYCLFLLAVLFLPVIGILFIFILPVPFIFYAARHTFKRGLLTLVVSLLITYMIGSTASLPITFIFGTTGLVMGYIYSLRKSAFEVLISGSLSFLANFVLLFIITNVFFHINFIEDTKNTMYQSLEVAEKMMTQLGEPTKQFELIYQSIGMISYIVPSAMVITSVFLTFIAQLFANQILKRYTYNSTPFPPLRQWSFPKSILWYYLIVTIIFMMGLVEEGTISFIMILNLFIVLEIIIAIQGFSFIFFQFYRKGKSITVPIIIVVVSLIMPFLLYIIRILGIIDLGFDLRKRMKDPQ